MPLNQVASVSSEDAKTLRVSPWDSSNVKAIEKALLTSDLGLSISADEKGVRASLPPLTAERRESLIKIVKEKLEGSRISLRRSRDTVWEDIQKKEQAKVFGEDEKFRLKKEMEKISDEAGKKFVELIEKKEIEIKS